MKRVKYLLLYLGIILLSLMLYSYPQASDPHSGGPVTHSQPELTSEAALKKLMDGNGRFIEGTLSNKDLGKNRRSELVKGQKPFAIILSCSDSRVPPEHIFDQGLGDIFVIRVAGNVAEPVEIGSIEYAVAHLGTPLVVVMGHQSCGAVNAAVHDAKDSEHIIVLVKKIEPAVKKAKNIAKDTSSLVDRAIIENTRLAANELTKRSGILRQAVEQGKLKIVAGVYNLASGKVDLIDLKD